jgi:glycine/D-amino acid oxidase-like deaminating enzyme
VPPVKTAAPPSKSLWLDEALARPGEEDAPALTGDRAADVCIVGGGYTGLWAALRLKELEPGVEVAIVEADVCGSGASGRNGGLVLSWWTKFLTLRKLFGADEALRLARASADAIAAIGEECARLGIDAGYRHDGYVWAASNDAQTGAWQATVEALATLGERPFEERTPEELRAATGTGAHVAGVFERTGATVQPALLARGLRRAAIDAGVHVFERSPMRAVESAAGGVRVRTAAGSVTASVAVLATNAWSVSWREIRRRVLVIGSDILATAPQPDRLTELGWTDGVGVSDSRLLVHYTRTTGDGRVVFGKGGGLLPRGASLGGRFDGATRRTTELVGAFRSNFPELAQAPVATTWTGPIDRSPTGLPFFGPLPGRPRVLVGVGYSGNGVGPSYLGGEILARLALDWRDELTRLALVDPERKLMPPEPLRWAGGTVIRGALVRADAAEDEGRRPGPVTRLVAGLPRRLGLRLPR